MTKPMKYETASQYNTLKADLKTYWVSDAKVSGLRMQVNKDGSRYWRFNYRFGGKQRTLAIGTYPDWSIKQARDQAKTARDNLKTGIDPAAQKQLEKERLAESQGDTFTEVATAWFNQTKATNTHNTEGSKDHWTDKTATNIWKRIEKYLLPRLGTKPISSITPTKVLSVMKKVQEEGHKDTSRRVFRYLSAILNYAKFNGKIEQNPADGAEKYLAKLDTSHQPTIQESELPQLLNDIDGYTTRGQQRANPLTQLALQLLTRTVVRSGELRGARWNEFNLKTATWTIPAERMKKKREHIVPLSNQALAIIHQIKSISGESTLLFPSASIDGFMSDNTLRKALFTLGYDGADATKSKCVPHGLRALAATILTEATHPAKQGAIPEKMFEADVIEIMLAHQQEDRLKKAYIRHPNHLELRRHMMQWLSDYFDKRQGLLPPDRSNVTDLAAHRTKEAL